MSHCQKWRGDVMMSDRPSLPSLLKQTVVTWTPKPYPSPKSVWCTASVKACITIGSSCHEANWSTPTEVSGVTSNENHVSVLSSEARWLHRGNFNNQWTGWSTMGLFYGLVTSFPVIKWAWKMLPQCPIKSWQAFQSCFDGRDNKRPNLWSSGEK